jgi:hypothetical protein
MADVKVDLRNESDNSVDEKTVGVTHAGPALSLGYGNLLPDPDAHLSQKERAAIVGLICVREKSQIASNIRG